MSKVESGELQPSLQAFARIAKTLKMTEREIVYVVMREGH